jgi:hypothetical protein
MTTFDTTMDSLLKRLTIIVALIAIAALAAFIFAWRDSRDAAIRLQATVDAAKKTITDAGDRENARDTQLKQALAQISAAKDRVKTPKEAAAAIPAALPRLPEPIQIELPQETDESHEKTTAETKTVPEKPVAGAAVASIPQADLVPLFDAAEDCQACQLKLSAAQADISDQTAKLAATSSERDAALKAANGGSAWSRVKRSAIWFIIGAGVGAISIRAVR